MEYEYKEDTLLHSIGFNLQRFVSVLNYGIVSKNKAKELGLSFSKNYHINGQDDDYISMLKVGLIDPGEEISAYKLHTIFGISFIVEDVPYVDDKERYFIHRPDEVLVKDEISTNFIKGIAIPLMYQNTRLKNIVIIPPDITNYNNVKITAVNYYNFLNSYGHAIDMTEFASYLNELLFIHMDYSSVKEIDADEFELEQLKMEFQASLSDLNEFLALQTEICFSKILGENITLNDVVKYLSREKYEIFSIPFDTRIENRKF